MSKYFNEDSARCLTCEGRLFPRGLAGNDKHLYTIGTLYKCRCGASSVWTNSIRNPVALLAFLDGTSTRYYQGFCNDLFDGKRGRTIMPLRSIYFAGEMQRGQVYGYDDTDVAVVWSGRFWSEQVGPGELIEWYAKHADVIRRAVAAETSHEAGRRNPDDEDESGDFKSLDHAYDALLKHGLKHLPRLPTKEDLAAAVAADHVVDVVMLLNALGAYLHRFPTDGEFAVTYEKLRERSGVANPRQKALFRKYGAVFARAVGAKTVDFTGAEYAASGRGAFGRLGGGRHGKYNAAGVIFKE